MRRLVPILLLSSIVLALTFGCGSSSKNTTQPPDVSGSLTAQAAAELALANGDYATANAKYKEALQRNPSNAQASAGAALTELFLAQDDPAVTDVLTAFGYSFPGPNRIQPVLRAGRALDHMGMHTRMRYDVPTLGGLAMRMAMRSAQDPPLASEIQSVIKNVLMPRLAYAESHFAAIEALPNFQYFLPPAATGATDTLEIDTGDILLIDAVAQQIHGILGALVAYNFDAPEGANAESLLTTPGSIWATLFSDGAAQLTLARGHLLLSAARTDAAVASILAETDDQSDDAVPQSALGTQANIDEVLQSSQRVTAALSGPVFFTFTNPSSLPDSERVNLGRFFTNAIPDLKTKLPNHTFDPVTHEPIVDDPITFPDPTFNLILPDMTNPRLRFLIGP